MMKLFQLQENCPLLEFEHTFSIKIRAFGTVIIFTVDLLQIQVSNQRAHISVLKSDFGRITFAAGFVN
eukprot:1919413-Amphidinium_carterae.1